MVDKDLGNIKLEPDTKQLADVTVVSTVPLFQMTAHFLVAIRMLTIASLMG